MLFGYTSNNVCTPFKICRIQATFPAAYNTALFLQKTKGPRQSSIAATERKPEFLHLFYLAVETFDLLRSNFSTTRCSWRKAIFRLFLLKHMCKSACYHLYCSLRKPNELSAKNLEQAIPCPPDLFYHNMVACKGCMKSLP